MESFSVKLWCSFWFFAKFFFTKDFMLLERKKRNHFGKSLSTPLSISESTHVVLLSLFLIDITPKVFCNCHTKIYKDQYICIFSLHLCDVFFEFQQFWKYLKQSAAVMNLVGGQPFWITLRVVSQTNKFECKGKCIVIWELLRLSTFHHFLQKIHFQRKNACLLWM